MEYVSMFTVHYIIYILNVFVLGGGWVELRHGSVRDEPESE